VLAGVRVIGDGDPPDTAAQPQKILPHYLLALHIIKGWSLSRAVA